MFEVPLLTGQLLFVKVRPLVQKYFSVDTSLDFSNFSLRETFCRDPLPESVEFDLSKIFNQRGDDLVDVVTLRAHCFKLSLLAQVRGYLVARSDHLVIIQIVDDFFELQLSFLQLTENVNWTALESSRYKLAFRTQN